MNGTISGRRTPSRTTSSSTAAGATWVVSACLILSVCGRGDEVVADKRAEPIEDKSTGASVARASGEVSPTTQEKNTDAGDAGGNVAADGLSPEIPAPKPEQVAVASARIARVEFPNARTSGVGPTAPGVPSITLYTLNSYKRFLAQEKNVEGLGQHKKLRSAAVSAYLEALDEDPAHVYARYNLACAYGLDEDPRALMLLEQLLAQGSKAAVGLVAEAPMDSDFRVFAKDPRFLELTSAAAARKKAGDYAEFTVIPTPSPEWVQIVTAEGRSFRLGDKIELTLSEPAKVGAVDVFFVDGAPCAGADCSNGLEPDCSGRVVLTVEGREPVFVDSVRGVGLEPAIETTKLSLSLDSPAGLLSCSHNSVWVSVLSEARPRLKPVEGLQGGPRTTPRLGVGDDGNLIIEGLPAISADGKMVAFISHYDQIADDDQRALYVVARGSEKTLFRRLLAGKPGPGALEATRFQVELANKKLQELSPSWRTLLPSGGVLPASPFGGEIRFLGAFDHPRLLLIDLHGRVIHRSEHPRWIAKPATRADNLSGEPEHMGVFVDPLLRAVFFQAEKITDLGPGINEQEWHFIELKTPAP